MLKHGRQKLNLRAEPSVIRALGRAAQAGGRSLNEQMVRYVKLGLASDGFVVIDTDTAAPEVVRL
jgi:predicted HicB family RNase H-like nuclease